MNTLDKTAKQYILDNIDGDNYGIELSTDAERIQFLHDTFYTEYGWMVDRVGESKALTEWLMGLPSACHIAFMNHEILQIAKEWGSLPENPTEKQEDKILANWFNFIANKIGQLFRGYRVPRRA